ncbi:MAG: Fe-S-cluster-containing hydrogenase [Bacteroidales bacterium]|nr:Fe-S-cluster-containing hydrogenase [Bacteroidales bacterium]
MKKKYWKSLEYLKEQGPVKDLVPAQWVPDNGDQGGLTSDRRDFLKMLGFSFGFAALASACEQPVRKAIPYLAQPEELIPGKAVHYASTFFDGEEYSPVVVKVRDGRPIKIEGNELSFLTHGGTSARVQASVLSLYDMARLKDPLLNGAVTDWDSIDLEITQQLSRLSMAGSRIVILTSSVISPSARQVMDDFRQRYPGTEIMFYDPISYSAIREANRSTFGTDAIPSLHFDRAEVILGVNADFLGTWLLPVQFALQYAGTRDLNGGRKTLSRHYQYESTLSLTGSNADYRYSIRPSQEAAFLSDLHAILSGTAAPDRGYWPGMAQLVHDLTEHRGKALVVSGTNDIHIQTAVNAINLLLQNYGHTIDMNCSCHLFRGSDADFSGLIRDMNEGRIGALICHHVNPAYDCPDPAGFIAGLKNLKLSVAIGTAMDETTSLMQFVCPDHHYLESWGDAEPVTGHHSLCQPAIRPLFRTRQAQDSFLRWSGSEVKYYDFLRSFWERHYFPLQTEYTVFGTFWDETVRKGIFEIKPETGAQPPADPVWMEEALAILKQKNPSAPPEKGLELILYQKVGIGTGRHANNPWLQELPDPITKAVWDNYLLVSPVWAAEQGLENGYMVRIDGEKELPVMLQPGQPYGTAAVAVGYGRTSAGKVGNDIGLNVYPWVEWKDGLRIYSGKMIRVEPTGNHYPLATTQTHHSMEGRPLVRETVLEKYLEDPASGNELHALNEEKAVTLYTKPVYDGFHWGLSVDLNRCIGCSACVIACQAENNVAVIGKEQVLKRRIMHWLRIDRYYSTIVPDRQGPEDFGNLEPENPDVVHQPVMCQHCDNAPCENVCPVAATPHSNEGLNMMTYNRCIGTRYCMNNCPYRVRRFNWFQYANNDKFDYYTNDELGKLVLNPDVTVRSRGVVEKCSFCSQRIQEIKLEAKKDGRVPADGEIVPACVQACPTKALTFGDRNDKQSVVAGHFEDPRSYHLLEELHTLSSVAFLTRVRNRQAGEEEHHDHHES